MPRQDDPHALAQGVLNGERRALARALTHLTDATPLADALLAELYPHTGRARLIGLTGAPGTGKSTLANALTAHLRGQGLSVAVLAVDPSSPFTRGAILGDRIRLRDFSGDSGVFIRSLASRGALGGLASATLDCSRALDAAGFEVILIETVGAGQSEVAIASVAQTVLVIEAPGLGDDIQATKAGILEIGDVIVVNKGDHPAADKTAHTLEAMLNLGHRPRPNLHHGLFAPPDLAPPPVGWQAPVLKTTASTGEGIPALWEAIQAHQAYLREQGGRARAQQLEQELVERLKNGLLARFLANTPPEALQSAFQRVLERQNTPQAAIQALLDRAML